MICSIQTIAKSLAAVALLAGVSSAATSWSTASGSSTTIDYASGQTENGLFTPDSPTVANNTFLFFPSGFEAGTESSLSTTDTLSFVVSANPGRNISRIGAGLNGDWSLLGSGQVNATGTLKVTNLATNAFFTDELSFSPWLPTGAEDGTFTGLGEILLPPGWVNAKVELTATVSVEGGLVPSALAQLENFTGLVQLKGADVNIDTVAAAVPLPGAVAIAPFAMGIAWFARRRILK